MTNRPACLAGGTQGVTHLRVNPMLSRAVGFGLSMGLLVVVSLVMIPSMVRASGDVAWGAIALGQAVGSIGAVLLAFGWALSGPAKIARQDNQGRRQEYVESVRARLTIFPPIALVSVAVAAASAAPGFRSLAAVSALSTTVIGLSSNWYFVGTVQPYALLGAETLPRITGSIVGILLMETGASALVGVVCQLAGLGVAFLVESLVILGMLTRQGTTSTRGRPVSRVLGEQRDGVMASTGSAALGALPLLLVSWVRPDIQPVYAFADKLARQLATAMGPIVTVFQGWIPRGGSAVRSRARKVILMAISGSVLLAAAVVGFGPLLVRYLGGGVIVVAEAALVAMAVSVAVQVFENILSHAVLPALDSLHLAAVATWSTGLLTLLMVTSAAYFFGVAAALGAVALGVIIRVVWEIVGSDALGLRPRPH